MADRVCRKFPLIRNWGEKEQDDLIEGGSEGNTSPETIDSLSCQGGDPEPTPLTEEHNPSRVLKMRKPPNQSDIRQYLGKEGGEAKDRLMVREVGSSLTVGFLPCLVEDPNPYHNGSEGGEEGVEDYTGSSMC